MPQPVSLADLGTPAASAPQAGGPAIEVHPLSLQDIATLLVTHPDLEAVIFKGDLLSVCRCPADAIDALMTRITGLPVGDTRVPAGSGLALISRSLALTFPPGEEPPPPENPPPPAP